MIADGVPFEVTTLRRDVETFGRHATIAFTEDWEEDARRRDFTLNALYAGSDGRVFDPLGGYADLVAGRVRFIGDAEARIKEDYLRILRFFRFNAYYGKGPFDPEGLQAAVRLRSGLDQLSAERVAAELRRLLVAPQAMRAIDALFDYGLLPGLLGSVPRLERFTRLVAVETLGIVPNAMVRLAALAIFVHEDARLAARLRSQMPSRLCWRSARQTLPERCPTTARRSGHSTGSALDAFAAHVLIAWATGAPPDDQAWREALNLAERWQAPSFPLRGSDIMALGDRRAEIGAILRRLEAEWIEGGFRRSA